MHYLFKTQNLKKSKTTTKNLALKFDNLILNLKLPLNFKQLQFIKKLMFTNMKANVIIDEHIFDHP